MQGFLDAVTGIANESGFMGIAQNPGYLVMIVIACVLLYLAIVRQFEPLLLLPIAFGMLLANLPFGEIIHMEYFIAPAGANPSLYPMFSEILHNGGLADMLYLGVKLGVYPPLIFLGIGTMTDFGPLISNPKSLLLGAAAQLGIFTTYHGRAPSGLHAAAGGLYRHHRRRGRPHGHLCHHCALRPSFWAPLPWRPTRYMALVPVIQPPIMKALTTKAERRMVDDSSCARCPRRKRSCSPSSVTIVVSLILPSCGAAGGHADAGQPDAGDPAWLDRINKTAGNELMNIITIFLGVSVGCTTNADTFLNLDTAGIILLGLVGLCAIGTAGGVLLGQGDVLGLTHGKVNPLIGAAGVSAVPMAARVAQKVGQKENPHNFLLMHAMGPNVAGVIGSAVAAGILINMLG